MGKQCVTWAFILTCGSAQAFAAAATSRIDLTESGRVVEMLETPASQSLPSPELIRGTDGWEAIRSEDGQYTIGVEWDEPREIAEVNIEFRHAIANREQIRVQYWQSEAVPSKPGDRPGAGEKARGRWLTPQTEWWAGDRDVSFSFQPGDRESSGRPDTNLRRTTRLRFLCGDEDLPPVRYLRAYGPDRSATDTFEFRLDVKGPLAPPVLVEAIDGYIMAADGKTKMGSAVLRDSPASLQIRYGLTDADSPNRTRLILSPVSQPEKQTVVFPIEAAREGRAEAERAGVTVERRGGKLANPQKAAASKPAEPR